MRLSVVVVTWRSRSLLPSCLLSLRAHAPEAEVVVVENGSGDGTPDMVRRDFPDTVLAELPINMGFAAGCNRGIEAASGDAVLLLNPDAEATPGAVQHLVETLVEQPEVAAVGGLLIGPNGHPQRRYTPRPFPTAPGLSRLVLQPRRNRRGAPAGNEPVAVDQVAGACLLVRRSAVEKIGGFDEGFTPVWFEDVDLCLRLRQAGHEILYHPGAAFLHQGGGSVRLMDAKSYYSAWYHNLYRFALKHHGGAAARMIRMLTVPGAGIRLAGTFLPGGGGFSAAGPGPRPTFR